MSLQVGRAYGVRQEIIRKTAKVVSGRKNNKAASMEEVLSKIQAEQDDAGNAKTDIAKKLSGGYQTKAQQIASSFTETSNAKANALAVKTNQLLEKIKALSNQGEGSLFLKSAATTQVAKDSFDLVCSADGSSFSMEVKQLAESQKNEGISYPTDQDSSFLVGRKYMMLTVDQKKYPLIVKVSADDTERSVMNKVVAAINHTESGITANVKDEGNTSKITVESNGTGAPLKGEKAVFYFENNGSAEDLIAYYGLNQVTQKGQDSIFNFNHANEDTTYMYNSALVDDAVSVNFKQVTNGNVDVAFTYDYDALASGVSELVEEYNSMRDMVKDSGYKAVENYFAQLTTLTKENSEKLNPIGISIGTDGRMLYNEGRIYQTDMATLKKTLNQKGDGYAAQLEDKAEKLQSYLKRLTGQTKKYYGLRAKKSNVALRTSME